MHFVFLVAVRCGEGTPSGSFHPQKEGAKPIAAVVAVAVAVEMTVKVATKP